MGKPVILHILERCRKINLCDNVILATTDRPIDDRLRKIAIRTGINVFRGNTSDVLDRYYQCARAFNLTNIVRVTGDCPLLDIDISSMIIDTYLNSDCEYVRTGLTYPDGVSTEVFSFKSLHKVWTNATLRSEREHVTPYFWKNQHKFRILSVESKTDLSNVRLTMDYPEDYVFIKKIYERLYHANNSFGLNMILDLLKTDNSLMSLMPKSLRYEGYYKSLKEDSS